MQIVATLLCKIPQCDGRRGLEPRSPAFSKRMYLEYLLPRGSAPRTLRKTGVANQYIGAIGVQEVHTVK